jgi:hypothetical protein
MINAPMIHEYGTLMGARPDKVQIQHVTKQSIKGETYFELYLLDLTADIYDEVPYRVPIHEDRKPTVKKIY